MTLHAFKNNGHPNWDMDDVVLSGECNHLLGTWDTFEFRPTILGINVFAQRIFTFRDLTIDKALETMRRV